MLKGIIRKIYVLVSNKKNGTIIKSNKASIKAKYGKGVLIDQNTIVDADVEIGEYSYINKNSSVENCIIGKYCSISSGVYIGPFEHDLRNVSTHPCFYESDRYRKRVIIGNDVLISLNAIILEGVEIGDGAVIGAGAVVTKNVAPYEVVGGVPARHIKYRFEYEERKALEKIKWWNWNREEIVKLKKQFRDIHSFVEKYNRVEKEKNGKN